MTLDVATTLLPAGRNTRSISATSSRVDGE